MVEVQGSAEISPANTGNPDAPDGGYEHLAPLFGKLASFPEGDPRRAELRDELVTAHLPLAEHIATRFSQRGIPREDLVQVARLGLINAVDRFRSDRGFNFLSFAVPTVMGEVRKYFRDTSWAIRVPRRLKELNGILSSASGELAQRWGRAPTPRELAHHLDLDLHEVLEGLEAGNAYHSISLDEALSTGADSEVLAHTLGEEDTGLATVEQHELLRPLLEKLPRREQHIIRLRFFQNLTQTHIAEQLGISQMHVSRLLSRALEKLREGLLAAPESSTDDFNG